MLWLRHYWTIKSPPLPLATTFGSVLRLWNYVQVVGGLQKRLLERLLILLMMSCPFKSRHLHSQMDDYSRGAPRGTEVIPTSLSQQRKLLCMK